MPREQETQRPTPFGDLYQLLERIFPEHRSSRDHVLDVKRLASEINLTSEGVYKWLRADRLPMKRARKLIELANKGRSENDLIADLSDFLPFVD